MKMISLCYCATVSAVFTSSQRSKEELCSLATHHFFLSNASKKSVDVDQLTLYSYKMWHSLNKPAQSKITGKMIRLKEEELKF